MSPRTATTRLYVALVSILASVLELCAALVRLVTALALRAASLVRPRPEAAQAPRRQNLRVVPSAPSAPRNVDLETGRLVTALVGMGWPVPAVRRFVDGLGDRVGKEPIEALIKEGLASLAA